MRGNWQTGFFNYTVILKREPPHGYKSIHKLLEKSCLHYIRGSISEDLKIFNIENIYIDSNVSEEAIIEKKRALIEIEMGTEYLNELNDKLYN